MLVMQGDTGWLVVQIQVTLGVLERGFGARTKAAVMRFQRDNGLKPDGKAGNNTLRAMGLPRDTHWLSPAALPHSMADAHVSNGFNIEHAMILFRNKPVVRRKMDAILTVLNANIVKYKLDNPMARDVFLAHMREETGATITLVESLNYPCHRLPPTFSRFRGEQGKRLAYKFGRCNGHAADQKAIANIAYYQRNGNIHDGDGWLMRGRSTVMVTGRRNYRASTKKARKIVPDFPDLEAEPHIAAEPSTGAILSAAYWLQSGMQQVAARMPQHGIPTMRAFTTTTDVINAGTRSKKDRYKHFVKLRRHRAKMK